jgi:hypothetical protein
MTVPNIISYKYHHRFQKQHIDIHTLLAITEKSQHPSHSYFRKRQTKAELWRFLSHSQYEKARFISRASRQDKRTTNMVVPAKLQCSR